MRLDHLLSKERLHPLGCESLRRARVLVGCSWVETLASSSPVWWGVVSTAHACGCGWGKRGSAGVGYGILLGPEGTSPRGAPVVGVVGLLSCAGCAGSSYRRSLVRVGWWLWRWRVVVRGGVLFESCIVDASIFVVKLLRADGGCLGTRSR